MKRCYKCGAIKCFDQFNKCTSRKDGLQTKCRICEQTRQTAYYDDNKDDINLKHQAYYANNKEKRKKVMKIWTDNNKERTAKKAKERLENDLNCKLRARLRTRLNMAVQSDQKAGSAVKDLGCSIPCLKFYLQVLFKEGMTWENYGKTGWHIDHIVPLVSFDLTNREQFLRANHFSNLQPLWAIDNLIKGAKLITDITT